MIISIRPDEEPFNSGGFFAAAMMAAFLIHTDEGDARGLQLDSDEAFAEFFDCYESKVIRDDWGYLRAELTQLHDAYIQLAISPRDWSKSCKTPT